MAREGEEYFIEAEAGVMEAVWEEKEGAHCVGFKKVGGEGKEPAKYRFQKVEEAGDGNKEVGLMTPVRVFNSQSGRGLSYRAASEGGGGGYFLVEAEEGPHVFHLEAAAGVAALMTTGSDCFGPFYLIHGPRVGGAGPVAFPASSTAAATFAKADPTRSHGDLPFFLRKVTCP